MPYPDYERPSSPVGISCRRVNHSKTFPWQSDGHDGASGLSLDEP